MRNFELKIITDDDRAAVEEGYKFARKLESDGQKLEAAAHYKRAAFEGHPLANYHLGRLYEQGLFGKDRKQMLRANHHYRQALFRGLKKAAKAYRRIYTKIGIAPHMPQVKYNMLANKFGAEWAKNNLPTPFSRFA